MKNSFNQGVIDHIGIVTKATGESVTVSITSASSCTGCEAEGSCNLSSSEEKTIDISGSYNVKPGDTVTVLMRRSTGYMAVLLGYVVPLIVVMTALILFLALKVPESVAGIGSISLLIPYYFILFLARKRISSKFTFTLIV